MTDCTSRTRITGSDVHDGKVVRCDHDEHTGMHDGPVPDSGGEPLRYAWSDEHALPDEPRTEDVPDEVSDAEVRLGKTWLAAGREQRRREMDERNAARERRAEQATELGDDDEQVHECGHSDAEHAAGEGMGGGIGGLLQALFQGKVPEGLHVVDMGSHEFVQSKTTEQLEREQREAQDAKHAEQLEQAVSTMMRGLEHMRATHRAALDSAAGHRAECEAAGFSPTAAEGMAFHFYMRAVGHTQ